MRRAMGQEFRKQREAAGISRKQMAKLTGLSNATVGRFEEGEYIQRPKAMIKLLVNTLRLQQMQTVIEAARQVFPVEFKPLLALEEAGFLKKPEQTGLNRAVWKQKTNKK